MTNQQGAPEALRLADLFELERDPESLYRLAAAELRRLHAENERLAALAGAQQPATSAAGAVSDEDEALDLLATLFDAWESGTPCYEEPESSDGFLGHAFRLDDEVFHRCADLLNRRRGKQPAPTPQADSAPLAAPADIVVLEAALRAIHQAIDLIGEPDTERLRTVRRVLRGAVVVAEDSTAPQADSQPAPEYVGNGMFKGETIQKAAEHWANWCDVRSIGGVAEFLRFVAKQADSVTAPATDSYVQPVPDKCDRIVWRGHYYHLPPTAQAADSVLEDAALTFTSAHIEYVARYGGRCRDCADEPGVCPGSGLPCADPRKAIKHVFDALEYGVKNGFIKQPIASRAKPASALLTETCPGAPNFDGSAAYELAMNIDAARKQGGARD